MEPPKDKESEYKEFIKNIIQKKEELLNKYIKEISGVYNTIKQCIDKFTTSISDLKSFVKIETNWDKISKKDVDSIRDQQNEMNKNVLSIMKEIDTINSEINSVIGNFELLYVTYYKVKKYLIDFDPEEINKSSSANYSLLQNESLEEANKSKSFMKEFYDKDDKNLQKDNERKPFLNSISLLIKNILLKCDYIFKNESEIIKGISKEKGLISQIFPVIKEKPENEDFLNFMNDINTILLNEFQIKKISEKKLNIHQLDKRLTIELDKIFDFKYDFDSEFFFNKNELDYLFNTKENFQNQNIYKIITNKNNLHYINSEEFYNYFNSLEKKNNKKKKIITSIFDEKNIKSNQEINKNKVKKTQLNSSELSYMIDCISNKNIQRNPQIDENIINAVNYQLENRDILTFKYFLIDFIITTEIFTKLSLLEIICKFSKYKEFIELYKFKLIIHLLGKECGIENALDNNGNFTTSGKEYKIVGNNKYCLVPRDWFGIGIKNVLRDNNEEWTRAYCSIGSNLYSDNIKKKLKNIIEKGFETEEQTGIRINLSLGIIEKNSGIIILDNIRFRIALMVKIKNEILTIENKENIILNKNNIKIISILLKIIE